MSIYQYQWFNSYDNRMMEGNVSAINPKEAESIISHNAMVYPGSLKLLGTTPANSYTPVFEASFV